MNSVKTERILPLLIRAYGNRQWRPDNKPVSTLLQTILSQNTSDTNSHRAFASLISRFGTWQAIASANTDEIAGSIRAGGLGEVKAKYIKQVLNKINEERGRIELDFLSHLPLEEARNWLTKLPGVGMKTASCVLLFSVGIPAFPVDTHVFRIAGRLGLIDPDISFEQAHKQLEEANRGENLYELHVLLIEHGRKICKARHPFCSQCILNEFCPSYNTLVKYDSSLKKP
jgi:endonuclease-3